MATNQPSTSIEEQLKSGVTPNYVDPIPRESHFEVNDECRMRVVSERSVAGGKVHRIHEYRSFIVRDKSNSGSNWQYQLVDKLTGQPHKGEEWFPEGVLKDP
ncbi:hypothetical protein CC78DRAFT_547268 [Lojkania enalia]|uniref:Uncharacterized protein n=1 Tax=Lojkania enalia TaxID=147567 RepID=A0A9P4K270_9PLEO|nr:hypothetical protein CC78DRAFT_547268 [Didymosphaeria enalia]